jgi:hypothetical protein
MNEQSAIYKVVGDDGKEYGPATAGQIRQWISEGRVVRETPIFMEGANDWNFVGLLPEFANCFAGGAPPAIAPPRPGTSTVGQTPATNSFATTGLIFGILSMTLCWCCGGFPFNLLGLIFSLIALIQINDRPQLHEGRGLALAGLILSIASFLIFLVLLATDHTHVYFNNGNFR